MELQLYDTYTRSLREFQPLRAPYVGLYTCGPTVYDYAHLGNLRTYIFEDLLRRTLAFNGFTIRHVMNITDVGHLVSDADIGEDKMEKGSRRTGKSAWEIAEFYTKAFQDDLKKTEHPSTRYLVPGNRPHSGTDRNRGLYRRKRLHLPDFGWHLF